MDGLPVVDSTELIHLPLAAALRPLTKATLVCTSSKPAVAVLSGTKQYPLDNFEVVGAVAEVRSLGTTTIACGAYSEVLTVTNPQVSSIVPEAPYLGAPARFRAFGTGLQPNMRFQVAGCAGDTVEFNALSGSSTERSFVCMPTVPASQPNADRMRLVNSKVNLAPNASFEPILDDSACSTSAERYARLLSQYGNKTATSNGTKYGEIPFLAMSWDDLKTFTLARRAPGLNLCKGETPADVAEERDRSLTMWRNHLAAEQSKVPPTYAGAFGSAYFDRKPSDVAKFALSLTVDLVGLGASATVLQSSVKAATRLKGSARYWKAIKASNGYASMLPGTKRKIERYERLMKFVEIGAGLGTVAFDAVGLLEPSEVSEMKADIVETAGDIATLGATAVEPFQRVAAFLDGAPFSAKVADEVLKLGVALHAVLATKEALSVSTIDYGAITRELGAFGAGFIPIVGPAVSMLKNIWEYVADGQDEKLAAFEQTQVIYSQKTQEILRSKLAESLARRFSNSSDLNAHVVPLSPRADFGGVQVDNTETLRVNLTNPSNLTWRIRDINFDAVGYSLVSNGCLIAVAPAGACHLVLRFSPVARAAYSDSLVLDYLIDDLPYRTRIQVVGVGLAKRSVALVKTVNLAAPSNSEATIALKLVNPSGVDTGCTIDRARVITANDALLSSSSLLSAVTTQRVPYGFVDFKLSGCNLGATQTIRIEYPAALPPPDIVKMWKRWDNGSTVETLQFGSPGLPFNFTILGNALTYTVTDGGPGDMDRTINGVIVDPAGVSFSCSLAVSGGTQPTASGDGVLLLRYLMGFRGTALTAGLTPGSRNTPEAIASFLGSAVQYDPLGRAPVGGPLATVEGLVLLRLMLGLPDAALLTGIAVPDSAHFRTGFDVRANVNSLCGTTY